MSLSNNILVSYGKRSFIYPVPSSLSELKKTASLKFCLGSPNSLVIQNYNASWGEYIDIFEDNELIPGQKYRILQLASVLNVEGSTVETDNNTSYALSQDVYVVNTSDLCESGNLRQPNEVSQSSYSNGASRNVVNGLCESLNLINSSKIPESTHFSSSLIEALEEKVTLSRVLRAELVSAYCKSITVTTKYPSSIMVTDAAKKIVTDFPHLTETTGVGYEGWRQIIRDKLKNLRRFDQSEEVQRKKKTRRMSCKIQNEQQNNMSISLKTASVERLIDEASHLEESFFSRRKEVMEGKMNIANLKTKFPSLFRKFELEKEFHRITGKLNLFQFVPKFLELYCEKLNTLLKAEKRLPMWAESIKCMLDQSNGDAQVVKEMLILTTLPVYFSESHMVEAYPPTVTESFAEEGSSSHHIAIFGLETNNPKFFVLADNEIVIQLTTLSEALAVLVASFYIFHSTYPKQWKKTFFFLESFIFEMHSKNLKIPIGVCNFVQKLTAEDQ